MFAWLDYIRILASKSVQFLFLPFSRQPQILFNISAKQWHAPYAQHCFMKMFQIIRGHSTANRYTSWQVPQHAITNLKVHNRWVHRYGSSAWTDVSSKCADFWTGGPSGQMMDEWPFLAAKRTEHQRKARQYLGTAGAVSVGQGRPWQSLWNWTGRQLTQDSQQQHLQVHNLWVCWHLLKYKKSTHKARMLTSSRFLIV